MKRRANTWSCLHEVHRIVCPTTWLNKGFVPEYYPQVPLVTELKVIDLPVLHFCCSFYGKVLTKPGATGRSCAKALDKYACLAYVVCLGA